MLFDRPRLHFRRSAVFLPSGIMFHDWRGEREVMRMASCHDVRRHTMLAVFGSTAGWRPGMTGDVIACRMVGAGSNSSTRTERLPAISGIVRAQADLSMSETRGASIMEFGGAKDLSD